MAITQADRDTLTNLARLLDGQRRGEYLLTNEVTFTAGHWLMDNIEQVQVLLDLDETIVNAIDTIEGLVDQQAMPDDFYKPVLAALSELSQRLDG
jgi:hypothetical protein